MTKAALHIGELFGDPQFTQTMIDLTASLGNTEAAARCRHALILSLEDLQSWKDSSSEITPTDLDEAGARLQFQTAAFRLQVEDPLFNLEKLPEIPSPAETGTLETVRNHPVLDQLGQLLDISASPSFHRFAREVRSGYTVLGDIYLAARPYDTTSPTTGFRQYTVLEGGLELYSVVPTDTTAKEHRPASLGGEFSSRKHLFKASKDIHSPPQKLDVAFTISDGRAQHPRKLDVDFDADEKADITLYFDQSGELSQLRVPENMVTALPADRYTSGHYGSVELKMSQLEPDQKTTLLKDLETLMAQKLGLDLQKALQLAKLPPSQALEQFSQGSDQPPTTPLNPPDFAHHLVPTIAVHPS